MKGRSYLIAAVIGGTLAGAGCTSPAPKVARNNRPSRRKHRRRSPRLRTRTRRCRRCIAKSVGYAVFPEVGKAGFIAGASYGNGEVFEGGRKIGYADITQGSFGLQAGARRSAS